MVIALLLLLTLFLGCAHRSVSTGGSDAVVRNIRFEGNGGALQGTSDFNLRNVMEQQRTELPRWLPLWTGTERWVTLDTGVLERDAWRLETWYAHH
ncbi:MAG: hypothetical protein QGG40_10090, partial [Myxococcota bacterium]|nr:hypothetical protein [Myxococcota bacterium]